MQKFKNDDLVIIKDGELIGKFGKIVVNEGPEMLVMLSPTKVVAKVHENHMEKIEGFSMKQEDHGEYQELIKALNIDIKTL